MDIEKTATLYSYCSKNNIKYGHLNSHRNFNPSFPEPVSEDSPSRYVKSDLDKFVSDNNIRPIGSRVTQAMIDSATARARKC